MGFLDGILGGVVGGEMASVVNKLVEEHGGLQGIIQQFQQKGLGDTVQSWISNGENKPIAPSEVHQALGDQTIRDLAARAGMTPEELSQKLSEILPTAIDRATPNGELPEKGMSV